MNILAMKIINPKNLKNLVTRFFNFESNISCHNSIMESTGENAYMCLVMRGDTYVPGAIVVAHSIRKTKTKNDICCMVTPDVSAYAIEQLKIAFDYVILVQYIQVSTKKLRSLKIENLYGAWKSFAYTKWNMLNMTQYKKVMFMDADILVVENIDALFELQTPAGTFSLSQAKPFVKKGVYNPYKTIRHGHYVDTKEIQEGFKSFLCIGTTLILTPNAEHFKMYIKMIMSMTPFGFELCINGTDEQSIVWFYHNILAARWTHIGQEYNMIPWKQKTWMPKNSKPYVLHYVGELKPWQLSKDTWGDLLLWWEYADDVEKCYPNLVGFTGVK
jgi:lipopolysaccharide biosynthesis glycosyltransferase